MSELGTERKLGVLLSYSSLAIRNVLGLLLIPFIIHHVGVSHYGIYSLVTTLAGYLIVLEFGLSNTIIRFISRYKANKDLEKEAQFIGIILVIYGAITSVVLLIGIVVWFNLESIFSASLTSQELNLLKPAFAILLVNVAVTLMSNSFTGIISAYERFTFEKTTEIVIFLLRCILVFIGLSMGKGVLTIVIVDTLVNGIQTICRILFVTFKLKVRILLTLPDRETINEIIIYTFFIALNVIVNQINWRLDNLIIGTITSSRDVGFFNIGSQLVFSFIAFATAISNIFTPKIIKLVTSNATPSQITNELIHVGRLQMVVLGYVLVAFTSFGGLFIELFVGKEFSIAYWVALIPMVPFMFVLVQTSSNAVLQAMNKHKVRSVLLLATAVMNVVISIILVKKIGMLGASIGTAITLFIGELVLVNIYLTRVIKLNMVYFYSRIFKTSSPVVIGTGAAAYFLSTLISSTWLGLTLGCTLIGIIYLALAYIFSLSQEEKKKFNMFILSHKK